MQTLDQLRAGELVDSRHLKLACGLTHFPPEILNLAESLEVLDLSGNALSELPDELAKSYGNCGSFSALIISSPSCQRCWELPSTEHDRL